MTDFDTLLQEMNAEIDAAKPQKPTDYGQEGEDLQSLAAYMDAKREWQIESIAKLETLTRVFQAALKDAK